MKGVTQEYQARQALRKGDKVEYFNTFQSRWVMGTVKKVFKDDLTIHMEETMNSSIESRYSEDIRPLWDPKKKSFTLLPPEKEEVKKVEKPVHQMPPKKKKSKKSKAKQIKKLSTETEIVDMIKQILKGNGGTNLSQLSNILKDHLKGGSWNGKQYKGKFGTITKFLKKHKEAFIVEENNGDLKIRNKPPPPKPKVK
eukprot:UN32484